MDKVIYSRLIFEWRRNRPGHVHSKILLAVKTLLIALLTVYIALYLLHSLWLFVLLFTVITLRFFYLHAKGDWSDLAEQLGLKCWHCHCVFKSEALIKQAMDNNACPHCQHSIYEKK